MQGLVATCSGTAGINALLCAPVSLEGATYACKLPPRLETHTYGNIAEMVTEEGINI